MGTTAEKLTYLNTTKQNLKTVINTTGAGLTNESTFRSYANVLNDKILGAINGDVDLFEEYPKVSGNGTDLSLNGVVEGKMAITPQGVSSQDGEPTPTTPYPVNNVTGENSLKLSNKNLLNITTSLIANRTNQGVTTNVNNNQSVTLTGTWNNSATQKRYFTSSDNDKILFPAGTYTLSSSPLTVRLEIRKVSSTSRITVDGTFTSEEDFYITNGTFILTYNQTYNTDVTIMLEKGSSATDYVPYEEQNYQLSLGNIELNSSPDGTIRDGIRGSSDVSYNLLDYTQWASGSILDDGSESTNVFNAKSTNYIPVLPNTTYSFLVDNNITNLRLNEYTNNKVHVQRIVASSTNKLTITTTANTHYLRWSLNYNNATTITEELLKGLDLMLIKGSEAKPYFPYGQVGMWYKREYIGKVVLNGTESWQYDSSNNRFVLYGAISALTDKRTQSISNYFIYNTVSTVNNSFFISSGNALYIKYFDITSLADFKTWLSTHNTLIYYPLATSTDLAITDTTLINQLNDIYNNANSYNGVTNITTTYEDGNEQMYLDIEALKNVWEVTE